VKPRAVVVAITLTLVLAGCTATPSLATVHVDALSVTTGSLSGGTELTLTGTGLDVITEVEFGDVTVPVEDSGARSLSVMTPASATFVQGDVEVSVAAGGPSSGTGLSFTYEIVTPVDNEMNYLFAHWKKWNTDEYGSLENTDCVNFTSQGLQARGWAMDDRADDAGWWFWKGEVTGAKNYSKAWISSTALRNYLQAHPDRGTVLDDPADAAIGDVVQFDWDNSGDPDHTAVVSRIQDGKISVVQHSGAADYLAVDKMLTDHPGSTFYVWHLNV
jgi:hypothetical protein